MGTRAFAGCLGTVHSDSDRPRNGRDVRPQPLEHTVRLTRGVRGSGGKTNTMDSRPSRVSRTTWHARQPGSAFRKNTPVEAGRRRPRPLLRAADLPGARGG